MIDAEVIALVSGVQGVSQFLLLVKVQGFLFLFWVSVVGHSDVQYILK